MSSDLLSIGSSGVQAQQKLLWTTGNNISNINTEGYTRQRTELYTNVASLGVGMSNTERMLNVYAQREMWRDTSSLAMYTSAYEQLASTDQYLSSSANSLNSAMSSYFSAFHTANANPNTSSSRQGLMSGVSSLVTRFQTASTTLSQQQNTINGSIESEVKEINSLLSGISDLNAQIIKAPKNSDGTTLNLIDQRDEMIRKLSEKMDIRTVAQDEVAQRIDDVQIGARPSLCGMCTPDLLLDRRRTQNGHDQVGVQCAQRFQRSRIGRRRPEQHRPDPGAADRHPGRDCALIPR